MAQVGMPVCVRKPVLWDPTRIGRTPYMARQDGRTRGLWEGEEREGGGGGWIAVYATGALPRTPWANHLRYLIAFYYGNVLVEP